MSQIRTEFRVYVIVERVDVDDQRGGQVIGEFKEVASFPACRFAEKQEATDFAESTANAAVRQRMQR